MYIVKENNLPKVDLQAIHKKGLKGKCTEIVTLYVMVHLRCLLCVGKSTLNGLNTFFLK